MCGFVQCKSQASPWTSVQRNVATPKNPTFWVERTCGSGENVVVSVWSCYVLCPQRLLSSVQRWEQKDKIQAEGYVTMTQVFRSEKKKQQQKKKNKKTVAFYVCLSTSVELAKGIGSQIEVIYLHNEESSFCRGLWSWTKLPVTGVCNLYVLSVGWPRFSDQKTLTFCDCLSTSVKLARLKWSWQPGMSIGAFVESMKLSKASRPFLTGE